MMQTEFIIETHLQKELIWSIWTDVKNWKKWNPCIEYSNLNGNFADGTYGSFKLVDGTNTSFEHFLLTKCIPNKSFIGRINLFMCNMDLGHEMTESENKLTVRHYVRIYGILAFYYKKRIGIIMSRNLNISLKKLIEQAGA